MHSPFLYLPLSLPLFLSFLFTHTHTHRMQVTKQKLNEGAAMGSPVSAVVANLYMELFEELALKTTPTKPWLLKQCVDDTCCVMKRGRTPGSYLSGIRPTIKFTMELGRGIGKGRISPLP